MCALAGGYALFFVIIALIQFSKQDDFSRRIGSLVVSGKYRFEEAAPAAGEEGEEASAIEDAASVFFGGLEFRLAGEKQQGGLAALDFDGIRRPLIPQTMLISANTARFQLSGGSVLAFYVQNSGGGDELIVSAHLAEDALSLELPYRLTRNAAVGSRQSARMVIVHNRQEYTFDRNILDTEREFIAFSHKDPVITYRLVMSEAAFNPSNYIISGAMGKPFYDDLVRQWSAKALSEWQSRIRETADDEALVAAYVAAQAERGDYAAALARIPEAFLNGAGRGFLSAPYIGRLEQAARAMTRFEEERSANFERILQESRYEFLREYKAFDYLLQRSKTALFEEAIQYIKTLPPDSLQLEQCPGVFESWWSYDHWYKGKENPFDLLANQARLLVSESLVKDADNARVFLERGALIDLFYNIRLGMSISVYGESAGNSEWAAVGRSLVLSALSFSDAAGNVAARLRINEAGGFEDAEAGSVIAASEIYPYLGLSDFYPHAVGADTVMFGAWLWTASPAVGASYKNNVLEFNVRFPLSSPHYLMIFGIRPFSRIQMRGMDYRSDPQFERYNSPGWAYLPQEQILLVKLVHRTEVEAVKIFF